jgi:capsular polysaccharide export protein
MATGEAVDPASPVVLFLQGPISPFFPMLAETLEAGGARTLRVNLCVGDWLFWRRSGAENFRGKPADWPAYVHGLMAREGVTHVVLLGEQRDYHKAAAAAADALGAQVIATDFGYLRPDWIAFEYDGLTGASRMPKTADGVLELAAACPPVDLTPQFRDPFWPMARADMLYHLSTWALWFLYPRYKTHNPNHPLVTYWGMWLRMLLQSGRTKAATAEIAAAETADGPVFTFPLQIARDFSIRAYSPYPDLETPIREVVASFAAHAPENARLIVKVHPLDPGLRSWRKVVMDAASAGGAEGRVRYIDGGDLGRLIDASAGVVVINSTVGLLSLQHGAPTIALGQAVYHVPGLTASNGLDAFWGNPERPDTELVEAFLRAAAGAHMVRGTFYSKPGLSAGVQAAAARILQNKINQPMGDPSTMPSDAK